MIIIDRVVLNLEELPQGWTPVYDGAFCRIYPEAMAFVKLKKSDAIVYAVASCKNPGQDWLDHENGILYFLPRDDELYKLQAVAAKISEPDEESEEALLDWLNKNSDANRISYLSPFDFPQDGDTGEE